MLYLLPLLGAAGRVLRHHTTGGNTMNYEHFYRLGQTDALAGITRVLPDAESLSAYAEGYIDALH